MNYGVEFAHNLFQTSFYSKQRQFEFELDYLILNLSRIIYVFTLFAKT